MARIGFGDVWDTPANQFFLRSLFQLSKPFLLFVNTVSQGPVSGLGDDCDILKTFTRLVKGGSANYSSAVKISLLTTLFPKEERR